MPTLTGKCELERNQSTVRIKDEEVYLPLRGVTYEKLNISARRKSGDLRSRIDAMKDIELGCLSSLVGSRCLEYGACTDGKSLL